jgi:hypothetical protein
MSPMPYRTAALRDEAVSEITDEARRVTLLLVVVATLFIAFALRPARDAGADPGGAHGGAPARSHAPYPER